MNKPIWPAEGIYPGIDPKTYFAPTEPRIISKSLLWDFYANPWRWLNAPPKEVTDSMKWGSLVDCLALTPERFDAAYKIQPDTYVNAPANVVLTTAYEGEWNGRTKACREWKAAKEAEGLTVMTPEEHAVASEPKPWNWNSETCKTWLRDLPAGIEAISVSRNRDARHAAAMLMARPEFAEMMDGAQTQVAVRMDFPEAVTRQPGIIRGKAMLDIVPARGGKWGHCLVDLKTTGKLDDIRQMERTIYERGYHAQAAFYRDMWEIVTGENREEFAFVFQQIAAPYEVAVVVLNKKALGIGREWYMSAIQKWAECVARNEWPSPWNGVHRVGVPDWAERIEQAAEGAAA